MFVQGRSGGYHDTSWSEITPTGTGISSGKIYYKRIEDVVTIIVDVTLSAPTTNWVDFGTLPNDYKLSTSIYLPIYGGVSNSDGIRITAGAISGRCNNTTPTVRNVITYVL